MADHSNLSNSFTKTLHRNISHDAIINEHPLVTVVIPSYNRASLLQQAVTSVQTQTYTNWELIVVDDGSTDSTAAMIRSMDDARITVFELSHCGNIAALRNAGAKAGLGRWLAFLDSDDIWVPQKLELQLSLLEREGKRWSYGGFEMINETGKTIPAKSGIYRPISGWISHQLLTNEAAVAIGSLMVEKDLFNQVGGFDPEPLLVCREDYELALRLALEAEVAAAPELLVKIREHPDRTTNTTHDGHERTAFVYEYFLHSQADKELKRIARGRWAFHLAEVSVKNMKKGDRLLAMRQLGKAFLGGDRWRHILSALRRGLTTR